VAGGVRKNKDWRMASSITLSRLADKGAETVKVNPTRIKAVDKEMESFGIFDPRGRRWKQYRIQEPCAVLTIERVSTAQMLTQIWSDS
jgi:hypothetical protein